jgi:hypothetical protein
MSVKDFLDRALKKDSRFKEVEREMKIQKMIEDRMKPANERELERYLEEERQKSITKNLEEFRKLRQKEAQETTILKGKNIFKGHKNLLAQDKSILDNGKGILNDKKLFTMGKGLKKQKGGLFFKK